ncbi:hypothetical protein STCU_04914 [Strigomonas culicis]|uniref:Uncharacterized protein n=1 Tax=Strigomonas culicis TaxID=28005 RepID=S9VNZ5_9TRYP|nr:hypothetical protein STCU_04914 [Strigomonas culicis]|eukprot:EPY28721.1 hypothetical protein STCU_04914 [Strigomonas culicis]
MADVPGVYSATSHVVAALQHEKLTLRKRLTDTQIENQILKQQLYQMSSLLDIAVSKLNATGVALDTPIDIRSLRADAIQRSNALSEPTGGNGLDGTDFGSAKGEEATATHTNKRFQLRTQLREHTKAVQCCAFSPEEDPLIVSGGLDCRLIVHNFFTGEKFWDIAAHDENISDVAWFEGTHQILSASYDGTVKLWDHRRPEQTPVYHHNASGYVTSATPLDKAFVFACADSRRRTSIVDVRTPKPISWDHDSRVNSIAFDVAASNLVLGHSNGTVSVWDLRKVDLALSGSPGDEEVELIVNASAPGLGQGNTHAHSSPPPTLLRPEEPSQLTGSVTNTSMAGVATPNAVSTGPALSTGNNNNANAATNNSPVQCISRFTNDPSHATVAYLAHYHCADNTKRLLCVAGDNMLRCYRGALGNATAAKVGMSELYSLRNVLPGVPCRGCVVRCGFWKGKRDKQQVSFFDDGEKDAEQPVTRRLAERDLVVTGGPDNTATVFDISDEGSSSVLEYLEGHRDRVTDAAIHYTTSRPIIATTSADSIVRIWMPVKT